jgi:hypothetical protein
MPLVTERLDVVRAVIAICLASQLVACGDQVTQVYVLNHDDVRYHLAFIEGPGPNNRIERVVGRGGAGLLVGYPGDVDGTVELLAEDCSVIGTAMIMSDATLITIELGVLHAQNDADLSDMPPDTMKSSNACPGT